MHHLKESSFTKLTLLNFDVKLYNVTFVKDKGTQPFFFFF